MDQQLQPRHAGSGVSRTMCHAGRPPRGLVTDCELLCVCARQNEMNAAATAAQEAFVSWRDASLITRQQVMFKLQSLIRDNMVRSRTDSEVVW